VVAAVFLAQLALIEWVGDYSPPPPRPSGRGPEITLAGADAKDLLTLTDPTLFALPHREGFSGAAWLSAPPQEIQPFAWTEPPRFIELRPEQLAASLPPIAAGYQFEPSTAPANFLPELLLARVDETQLFPDHSTLSQAGPLRNRPLKTRIVLPSWHSAEILGDTVVQVLVDPEGATFAPILLGTGCGLKEADDYAVRQAEAARFAPLPHHPGGGFPLSGLVLGELVFEWHTLPGTNSPAQRR